MADTTPKPIIFLAFANDRDDTVGYLRNLPVEARRLREVLEPAEQAGLCEVIVRSNSSAADIFKVLQNPKFRNRVAIFHYSGHANGYQLLLESPEGKAVAADAGGLAAFLAQQQGLQLVFLNGCSTQQQTQELHDANVSVVISTSRAIDDKVATEFADLFYQALAGGANLLTAYNEASAAIKTTKGGDLRALYFGDADKPEDHRNKKGFPWNLYPREGAENADQWSLPNAVDDPLFGLPPLPPQDLPETPYRHLNWFTREHAEIFFGRGHQIRELYNLLTAGTQPIILFYGQSGVGKSSLLDAGLLPRLERDYEVRYARRGAGGLLATLQSELLSDATDVPIEMAWLANEEQLDMPLIVFLDQVEEVYTRPIKGSPDELDQLLRVVKATFSDPNRRPKGKLVLGFREEWLAKLEAQVQDYQLPRTKMFLKPLDRRGIIEVVQGPTRSKRLRERYALTVEPGLAEIISDDLMADRGSAISTTLQILLSKMWIKATEANSEPPQFSQNLYHDLKRDGILLRDFLNQQIAAFRQRYPQVVDSGLLLDIVALHTTPLGTAGQCTVVQLQQQYVHLGETLPAILQQCQDLYLLTVTVTKNIECTKTTRLAHDTLAPIVREQFDQSDRPGQRARRILDAKLTNWQQGKTGAPLDSPDLRTVEEGYEGTRKWNDDELRLVVTSRGARQRKQRMMHMFVALGLLAIVCVVAFGGYAEWQRRIAHVANQQLEKDGRTTDARQRAALSQSRRFQYPTQSVELALAAFAKTDRDGLYVPEAEQALRDVLATVEGQRIAGNLVSVSNNGDLLVTAARDTTLAIWKPGESKPKCRVSLSIPLAKIAVQGNWLAGIYENKLAHLWNISISNSTPVTFPAESVHLIPPDWVIFHEPNSDNNYLTKTSSLSQSVATFQDYCLSENDHWLVTIDSAGGVQLRSLELENQPTQSLGNFPDGKPVAISNEGRWCVVEKQSAKSNLMLVDSMNPTHPIEIRVPTNEDLFERLESTDSFCFSSDGHWMAMKAIDPKSGTGLLPHFRRVLLWNVSTPEKEPSIVHQHVQDIAELLFADGRVVSSDAKEIIVTELDKPDVHYRLRGNGADISALSKSPDQRYLVAGFQDHSIRQWDLREIDQEPRVLFGHDAPPKRLSMTLNNEWLVSADDNDCRLWRMDPSFRGIEPLTVTANGVWTSVAFSSDSQTVFVGGSSEADEIAPLSAVRVETAARPNVTNLVESFHDLGSLQVSPDGKWLIAISTYLEEARLFSMTGTSMSFIKFPIVSAPFTSTTFSRDSRWLVLESSHNEGEAVLVSLDPDRRTAAPAKLDEVQDPDISRLIVPRKAAIDPEGQWLLTADKDSSIRLWRVSNGSIDTSRDATLERFRDCKFRASSP